MGQVLGGGAQRGLKRSITAATVPASAVGETYASEVYQEVKNWINYDDTLDGGEPPAVSHEEWVEKAAAACNLDALKLLFTQKAIPQRARYNSKKDHVSHLFVYLTEE